MFANGPETRDRPRLVEPWSVPHAKRANGSLLGLSAGLIRKTAVLSERPTHDCANGSQPREPRCRSTPVAGRATESACHTGVGGLFEAAPRDEVRSSNREPDGDAERGAPASLRSNEMEFSGERSESAATTG